LSYKNIKKKCYNDQHTVKQSKLVSSTRELYTKSRA